MAHQFKSLASLGANPFKGATMKDVDVAKEVIRLIMVAIDADPIGPTRVVADGKQAWINRFLKETRGVRLIDRGNAEILWVYFEHEHARRFPNETPSQVLDDIHERTPATAADIRRSIRHDIASTEEGRRAVYGPDSYDVENAFKRALDEVSDEELTPKPLASPSPDDLAGPMGSA